MKSTVIEERRVQLQAWLEAVAQTPSLRCSLFAFLGVSARSFTCESISYLTHEEKAVTDFLANVESNPRAKLSSLVLLDQTLFARKTTVRVEYLRRLLDLLVLLSADHVAGCKAVSVLYKLTCREHYRDTDSVIQEWLSLGPDKIRSMGLDLHLLRLMSGDTRGEAFALFKIVHGTWAVVGRTFLLTLVSGMQLNDNLEAFRLFERWLAGKLSIGEEETPTRAMCWQTLENTKGGSLKMNYRFAEEGIEIKAWIRIDAPCEKVLKCIIAPDERVKWDYRVRSAVLQSGDINAQGCIEYTHEVSASSFQYSSDFKVTRQLPKSVRVEFRRKGSEDLVASYTIIPEAEESQPTVKRRERTSSSFSELQIPDIDEEKSERHDTHCLLKYSARMPKDLGKLILPDLLGESDEFQRSFENLKRLAEKDSISPLKNSSALCTAVERKSLTPKCRKHKQLSRMSTVAMGSPEGQSVARKVVF